MSKKEYTLRDEFKLSRSRHGRTKWVKNLAKIALKQAFRNMEKAIDEIELPEDHINSNANLTLLENAIIYEILKQMKIGDVFKVFISHIRSYRETERFGYNSNNLPNHLRLWGHGHMSCKISTYSSELSEEDNENKVWRFISTMRSNILGRWDYDRYDLDNGNYIIIILPSLPSLPSYYDIDKDLVNQLGEDGT